MYTFATLADVDLRTLTMVFNAAFANYFVPVNSTAEQMSYRFQRARVDLQLSVGAFQKDELVGFMLGGIGNWAGKRTVYNAGTGVIPKARGQRLVAQLYNFVFPLWRAAGLEQTTLEVITENERAIRAYQSVGYQIDRSFTAYKWSAEATSPYPFSLRKVQALTWDKYERVRPFAPSWDFTQAGVEAVQTHYQGWELLDTDGNWQGFAIVHESGQLAQAGCTADKYWLILLQLLGTHYPTNRWINVPDEAKALVAAIKDIGGEALLSQHEMSLLL